MRLKRDTGTVLLSCRSTWHSSGRGLQSEEEGRVSQTGE